MKTPAGYGSRAPRPKDLDAVAGVLLAEQHAAGTAPILDAFFVAQSWNRPGFQLDRDAVVVTDGSLEIVAYAQVRRDDDGAAGSWGVVHPDHTGHGIGTGLLDWLEVRAAALLADEPSVRFRHAVMASDDAAAAMLRERGLRPIRHYWHMQIDLAGQPDPGPAPVGVDIAPITSSEADLRDVHAVIVAGFAQDTGDRPESFDSWVEEHTSGPGFDPSLWLLARAHGTAVGALATSADDGGAWVDWLAVLPSHRGHGIASALLHRTFAACADRGIPRVLLNVNAENPTGATAVYERAGMRVANRWDLWERDGPAPTG